MNYTQLNSITNAVELDKLELPAVKELQTILKKLKLYGGTVDGIAGKETADALATFKRLEFLEYPTVLGKSTVQTLLDAVQEHPTPNDPPTPSLGKVVKLPGVSKVWASKPIYDNCAFTWGEATKGLTRLPSDIRTVENIIKAARKVQQIREFFDRPITVNSWYRPVAVNAAVGGVPSSRHIQGDAVDIVVSGVAPKVAVRSIRKLMGNDGGVGDSTVFTHIDMRGYPAFWNYGS